VIERVAPNAVGLDINELTPAYDRGERGAAGRKAGAGIYGGESKGSLSWIAKNLSLFP